MIYLYLFIFYCLYWVCTCICIWCFECFTICLWHVNIPISFYISFQSVFGHLLAGPQCLWLFVLWVQHRYKTKISSYWYCCRHALQSLCPYSERNFQISVIFPLQLCPEFCDTSLLFASNNSPQICICFLCWIFALNLLVLLHDYPTHFQSIRISWDIVFLCHLSNHLYNLPRMFLLFHAFEFVSHYLM